MEMALSRSPAQVRNSAAGAGAATNLQWPPESRCDCGPQHLHPERMAILMEVWLVLAGGHRSVHGQQIPTRLGEDETEIIEVQQPVSKVASLRTCTVVGSINIPKLL